MKTLLIMVLTMGLAVASVEAQDEKAQGRRGVLVELDEQPREGKWLKGLGITPEQWGNLKAERLKFSRVMKLARNDLEDSIKVILRPEQLKALEERREKMRQRAERWKQGRNGSRPHRHKLPEEWKEWNDEQKEAWKQERREKRKARREKHNAEKNGKE